MRTVVHPNDTDPLAVSIPEPVAPATPGPAPVAHVQPARPQPALADEPLTVGAVQDEGAEKTACEVDSAYFGIGHALPTKLAFYDYSKISIRPYRLAEKFKLGAATKSGQIRYIIEAVGACIDRPIMSLALMDFWYLCYWLRTQSYNKSPFTVNWGCEAEDHLKAVLLDEVDDRTRVNETMIQHTDIRVREIDIEALKGVAQDLADMDVFIQAPTVADFLDKIENGATWDPEFSFMADKAVFLRADRHGNTIAKRVEVLRKLSNHSRGEAIMGLLIEAETVLEKAGLDETVGAVCKHCGVHQQVSLEVDLLTFFPFGI